MRDILTLLTILCLTSFGALANEQAPAIPLFEKMKSLVGVWHRQGDSRADLSIEFELTANDTTLLEIWNYKGKKHSLTVYHLDGETIMATHYCPQGNQPRLVLDKVTAVDTIDFGFLDISNLESPAQSHQQKLGFTFTESKDKVLRRELYVSDAGEEESELVLLRSQL